MVLVGSDEQEKQETLGAQVSGEVTSTTKAEFEEHKGNIADKFKSLNWFLAAVLLILVVGFIQLIVDSFRFSSVTYREYSRSLNSVEETHELNQLLLQENTVLQKELVDQISSIESFLKNK